jgi:soluble lytic murein transglycosylase-like protein
MSDNFSLMAQRDPQAATIARRRALADRLLAQSTQQDFRHPLSIGATVAQALAGTLMGQRADDDLREYGEGQRTEANQFLARMLGGQGAPTAMAGAQPAAAPQTAPATPAGGGAVSPAVAPADLMPHIEEAARETGIPAPLLVAQIRQESNFDPNARGRAGEIGLGQIMPATARQPGYGVQPVDPAALSDPRTNIRFQAQYLRGRGQAAGVTDWNDPAQVDRALAAYNGGGDPNYVQNVRRWMGPGGATVQASAPPSGGASAAQPAAPTPPPINYQQAALEAMQSNNPRIRELAPLLAQMGGREQQARPTVTVNGPQGPGVYERLPNGGLRFLGGSPEAAALPPEVEAQRVRLAEAGRTQVNVPVNTERGFYGELAQRGGQRIDALQQQATQGAEAVRSAQRVQALLDGGAITGTGAGTREAIERAFVTAGLVDGRRVANTGQLMAELAGATLAAAGNLSGPTSDRDILFLREVAGGRLDLTADTIRRIVQISSDRAGRTIQQYNEVAAGLANDPSVPAPMRTLYRPIEVPRQDAQPEQRQQDVPRPRTPEEMNALPPGTVFYAPDGSLRRRP